MKFSDDDQCGIAWCNIISAKVSGMVKIVKHAEFIWEAKETEYSDPSMAWFHLEIVSLTKNKNGELDHPSYSCLREMATFNVITDVEKEWFLGVWMSGGLLLRIDKHEDWRNEYGTAMVAKLNSRDRQMMNDAIKGWMKHKGFVS